MLASSNSGSKVNFTSGTKDVFITYPAGYSVNSTNNPGTTGQVLKSNGTGVAPTWNNISTYLPVLTNAGSTTNVTISNGYLSVLTNSGSTVNVLVS